MVRCAECYHVARCLLIPVYSHFAVLKPLAHCTYEGGYACLSGYCTDYEKDNFKSFYSYEQCTCMLLHHNHDILIRLNAQT